VGGTTLSTTGCSFLDMTSAGSPTSEASLSESENDTVPCTEVTSGGNGSLAGFLLVLFWASWARTAPTAWSLEAPAVGYKLDTLEDVSEDVIEDEADLLA
jgi:hypothetical protein